MKPQILTICALLTISVSPSLSQAQDTPAPATQPPPTAATTPPTPAGPEIDGYTLSIQTEKTHYLPDEPVILTAVLKNVSKERGLVFTTNILNYLNRVTVTFLDNKKEVPLKMSGYKLILPANKRNTGLKPEEELSTMLWLARLEDPSLLNKYTFDLSRAGTYHISVSRYVPKRDKSNQDNELTSNTLEINIDEQPITTPPTTTPDKK